MVLADAEIDESEDRYRFRLPLVRVTRAVLSGHSWKRPAVIRTHLVGVMRGTRWLHTVNGGSLADPEISGYKDRYLFRL